MSNINDYLSWRGDLLINKNNIDESLNHYNSILDNVCMLSSDAERRAVDLERMVNDMKAAEYMEDKVGQTNSYLEAGERIIAEASFRYKDLFCAVDLLKVDDDGLEIYELKSRSSMSESFIDDISFQTYVLRKLGYKIKGSYVLHINKDYILEDELNMKLSLILFEQIIKYVKFILKLIKFLLATYLE